LKYKRGGDCLKLTIYFDGSFWCGLIEYEGIQGDYRACRYVFGPEPKDKELEQFIYFKLQSFINKNDEYLNYSVSASKTKIDKKISPKKMQRKINKEKRKPVMSTKAQLAITKSREQKKSSKKQQKGLNKRRLEKEKFDLKQKRKLEKKKGH